MSPENGDKVSRKIDEVPVCEKDGKDMRCEDWPDECKFCTPDAWTIQERVE